MSTVIELLLTFLLGVIWQSALVVGAAWLGAYFLNGAPVRIKYWLWTAAIVLALVLPAATAFWGFELSFFSAQEVAVSDHAKVDSEMMTVATSASDGSTAVSSPADALKLRLPEAVGIFIAAIYVFFTGFKAGELTARWRRTQTIRQRSFSAELSAEITSALLLSRRKIDDRNAEILFSSEVPVPITIGGLRPAIILPEKFLNECNEDVLVTAIGHELVHIERRDYLANLVLEILCIPLSFHPAVLFAKGRLANMRELCCDEAVATRLIRPEAYARSLLSIAAGAPAFARFSPIITVGITDAENLEVRIMSLLKRSEMSTLKKCLLAGAAVALLAVPLALAGVFSPAVTVDSASTGEPQAAPTAPVVEEKKKESMDTVKERESLERKLVELKKAQMDVNLTERQRVELGEMESKLERRLERSGNELGNVEDIIVRSDPSDEGLTRLDKEKLAKSANISMEQAIELALAANPGTLKEKGIGSVNGEVVFKILIRDEVESADHNASLVFVSGIDGRIVKTEFARIELRTKKERP